MFEWFKRKSSTPTVTPNPDNPFSDSNFLASMANANGSGKVSYTNAMRQQDVYSCIRIKSESLGQLPVQLFKNVGGGQREEITSGREHKIFTKKPNSFQNWQEFIEQYVASVESRGNFYALINRNRYGNVYEIVPFRNQASVRPQMDSGGNVFYTYSTNDGKSGVETISYDARRILHIKLFSTDGFTGLSPISQNELTISSAISGDTHTSALFSNGARPSGVLSTEQTFGADEEAEAAIARLKSQWNELYQGPMNGGKTAVLEFGMQYQPITMSAVDTQLIEQRKYSREQIAGIFRIPLHMLGDPSGLKYNTVEQTSTAFFRDALMPLVTRLENNLNELLPENHFIKLNENEFVRGDRAALIESVGGEVKMGVITINQAAMELGRPQIKGGDVYAIATNNITYGTFDQQSRLTEAEILEAENKAKQAGISQQPNREAGGNNE